MFKRNKKKSTAASPQPAPQTKFYEPQKHADTIVFVHGILGNYVTTWGRFPQLLSEDDDLPPLDVMLWGYPTGCLSRHNELEDEGAHLITTLNTLVRPSNEIFLVGHSMGGLVILKGLVDRMNLGHAQTPPCKTVAWVTLYASPLNGAWAAGVARIVAGPVLYAFRTLHKHLRALSRGTFVDSLMAEVVNRIYRPTIEDTSNRKIPIRIVAATRDGAVDRANRDVALSVYRDPEPHQLNETHTSVKLPTYVGDIRYRVLFNDLQLGFARTFRRLCSAAIDAVATPEQREAALSEIIHRYGKIIRRRVIDVVRFVELRASAENEFLILMAFDGATRDIPPFDAANRAMIVLAARHTEWR